VRAIGNDLHMDYSAIGQTTHVAARMEQLVPPGTIRLTAETLRLAEGLGLCRKFCSGGHEGGVAPVRVGITRRGSRIVRPL
jgi:class 3 adenylate cyclase